MASASQGATPEAIEKVLSANGFEAEKPEPAASDEPAVPTRDQYESDEAFEDAQEKFEADAEEREELAQQEAERKEEAAQPVLSRKQKAIVRATRELKEENRKLAERLAAVEGGKKPVVEAPKIEAPRRADFKDDAAFDDAMFEYRYKVRRAKESAEAAQTAQSEALKTQLATYQTSVADFKAKHDDWDEVVNQTLPIHEAVILAVMKANNPAVAYYLGKNEAYTRKLAAMDPLDAVMEVGRLVSRLKTGAPKPGEADSKRQPRTKSRLPEPVRPVSTSASSSTVTSREAAKSRNYQAFKTAQRAGR